MPRSSSMTEEQFTTKAIETLRSGKFLGIHSVYSGFNAAFRQYFGTDPVAAVRLLEEKRVIMVHPSKGGVIIYKSSEAPVWLVKQRKSLSMLVGKPQKPTPLQRIVGDG